MVDAVNVVDLSKVKWDNKIRVCRAYQKRVGTRLWNLNKKEKGLAGRCCLTDTTIDWL